MPDENVVESYLLESQTDSNQEYKKLIRDVMEVIHAKQHPSPENCKSKRLLAVQMSSTSFEGTGSILKQVMISLAVAMHSNRTLIWGLGHPFLFEHTKELWSSRGNDKLKINDDILNCSKADSASGPFGCFFLPLSTCTLNDVSPLELLDLSHNPYNESARVMLSEIRKGVALYHPPFGLFDYIMSNRGSSYSFNRKSLGDKEAHVFAAAVAAYAFRLKPELVKVFKDRHAFMFEDKVDPVWTMHVRHGDLRALSDVYLYRPTFEFEHYFERARQLSHKLKETPGKLFVATDSMEADEIPSRFDSFFKGESKYSVSGGADDDDEYEEEEEEEYEDDEYDMDEDDEEEEEEEVSDAVDEATSIEWYGEKKPKAFTIENVKRYRTEHGSHTVAANGGCLRDPSYSEKGMRCSLNYDIIVKYQGLEEHRSVPRSYRLMRVLLESIEDMFLLSQGDAFVSQGSSHFSTLAALLTFAHTAAVDNPDRVAFVDQKAIEQGFTPSAYLHGMNLLNGTHGVQKGDVKAAMQRWVIHTNSFLSGTNSKLVQHSLKLDFDPFGPQMQMTLLRGFPHLPEKSFYLEAKTWLGQTRYKPVLPGHCPGKIKQGEDVNKYAGVVINLGVDHLEKSHSGQAIQCWKDAIKALEGAGKDFLATNRNAANALSVAKGNLETLRVMRYAEMVINENHNTDDFFDYSTKYMDREYDGVAQSSGDKFSLDELNEDIAKVEKMLLNMKDIRDKLVAASGNEL